MPKIGIIRGFGEGKVATDYIIRIIKALKRRFRTKISFVEIPLGDCLMYGSELKKEAVSLMEECDVIFAGDFLGKANPLEYTIEDVAMIFSDIIKNTCIVGLGDESNTDLTIASYFDGGSLLREGEKRDDGAWEMRMCSSYSARSIAKNVARKCENRRRRLAFVKDGDNEYCADMFYSAFSDFTMPLSNFHLLKFSTRDITSEIFYDKSQFDVIFASETFADIAWGIYRFLLDEKFASYILYSAEKPIYYIKGVLGNSECGDFVPSMKSYIVALCDMLDDEFGLKKESVHLQQALERVVEKNIDTDMGKELFDALAVELDKPVLSRYNKMETRKQIYIK